MTILQNLEDFAYSLRFGRFCKFFQIWKSFGKLFQIRKKWFAAVAATVKTKSSVQTFASMRNDLCGDNDG